jgi:hypothetical protein
MMKRILGSAAIIALLTALVTAHAPAFAEVACNRPAKIKIPDPAKAEAKDFEKTYKDLTAYHGAMTTFNDCLKKEAADAAAEYLAASQDYEKAVKAYNASADKANKPQ